MNVSFNVSPPTIPPPSVGGPDKTEQTSRSGAPTLTVTIAPGGSSQAGGTGAITLSYPLIGPEDININEFLQQLESLDVGQLKASTLTTAVLLLNQQIGELGAKILQGGPEFVEANAAGLKEMFASIEDQAKKAETQLFDVISNSTYPQFNDFLSKMLAAAQEIRQMASEARLSLVMAEYDNINAQADLMMKAAQKNYESTMKNLEAEKMEAIGKIVAGSVSLLTVAAGAVGGAATAGAGTTAAAGASSGIQSAGAFSSAASNIIDGSFSMAANELKRDGAALKLEADLFDVDRKRLEATQKILQESQNITSELRDLAKTLSDMVLKLYQDFMANQQQIIQRANI